MTETWNGTSLMTIRKRPLSSTISALPRSATEPRPVLYAWRIASRPCSTPPVGKSGPCTMSHSASSISSTVRFASGDLVLDQVRDRVADLADVVRRDVGRHPDRDPRAAVDEQLRQPRGQHDRLFGLVVEVGDEIDGLFVDVREHVERDARQPRFGVAVRGRRIGIDRAEVAVAVDERIAQREVLRHAHERVVDRRIAVRVKALEHLADDAGALAVLLRGVEPHLAHRVQDAALHRLEAVAHVGQRARGDDRHGIGEIALPHLVFDGDGGHPGVVVHGFFTCRLRGRGSGAASAAAGGVARRARARVAARARLASCAACARSAATCAS